MTMLGIMGVLLVFTALALAAVAARNAAPSTGVARSLELIEAMTTAPSELKADLDKSVRRAGADPAAEPVRGSRSPALRVPTAPSGSAASSTSPATRPAGPSTG